MYKNNKIAVVIPCFSVKKHIKDVIKSLPNFIDYIISVDDLCPEKSYKAIQEIKNEKIIIICHKINEGVGGAVISGYKKALELDCDIIIKIDGDGQMDPKYITDLINPIISSNVDYTKGNRFKDFIALRSMPKIRLFGNSILSFLIKISSGYWNIMDPTNGFTAIKKDALYTLNLNTISKRYFFESDMLINLNINNCIVKDIYIPAKYGNEDSSLSISKVLIDFPPKILKGLVKRIFFKYYIYDFNMASIYLLIGIPMVLFGTIFGLFHWINGINSHVENSTGTVMLAVLPIILGVQFLLQAINIDINNKPEK